MLPNNFSFVLPGKLAGMARPPVARDALQDALIDLGREGVRAVVSLTETAPAAEVFREAGFAHLHVPIMDFSPPAPGQVDAVVEFVRQAWEEERGVAIHCAAGYGRTGTLLACVLVDSAGLTAQQAIDLVRTMRPYSIETGGQEQAVFDYASRAQNKD